MHKETESIFRNLQERDTVEFSTQISLYAFSIYFSISKQPFSPKRVQRSLLQNPRISSLQGILCQSSQSGLSSSSCHSSQYFHKGDTLVRSGTIRYTQALSNPLYFNPGSTVLKSHNSLNRHNRLISHKRLSKVTQKTGQRTRSQ